MSQHLRIKLDHAHAHAPDLSTMVEGHKPGVLELAACAVKNASCWRSVMCIRLTPPSLSLDVVAVEPVREEDEEVEEDGLRAPSGRTAIPLPSSALLSERDESAANALLPPPRVWGTLVAGANTNGLDNQHAHVRVQASC
jgi:hypothetical protein